MGLEKLKSAFSNITKGFGDDLGLDDFSPNRPTPTPPKTTPDIPKGFGDDLGLDDYSPNRGGIGDINKNIQNQVTFSTQTPHPFQPKGFGDDLGLDDYDLHLPPTPPKTTPDIPKGFGDDLGLIDFDASPPPPPPITPPKTTPNIPKGFGDDLGLDDYDPNSSNISDITQNTQNPIGFGDDLGLDDFDANKPKNPMSSPPKTTPNIPKGFGDDLGLDDFDPNSSNISDITQNTQNPIGFGLNNFEDSEFNIDKLSQEVDYLNDKRYPVVPGFNAGFNNPGNTYGDGDIGNSKYIGVDSGFPGTSPELPHEVDYFNNDQYPVVPGFNAGFNTPGNTWPLGNLGDSKYIDIGSGFQNTDTSINPYNGTTVNFTTDTHAFGFTSNLTALSDSQFVGVSGTAHNATTTYYDSIHTRNAISDTFGGPVDFFDNTGADGFTLSDSNSGDFYTTQFKTINADSFIKPDSIMDFDSWDVRLNKPFHMTFNNQTTGKFGVDLMAGFNVMGGFGLNLTDMSNTQFKGIAGGDDTAEWTATTSYYDNVHNRNTIGDSIFGPVNFLDTDNVHTNGFTLNQTDISDSQFIGVDGTTHNATTTYYDSVHNRNPIDDSILGPVNFLDTDNVHTNGFTLNQTGISDTQFIGIASGDDIGEWTATTDYYDSIHTRNTIDDTFLGPINFMDSDFSNGFTLNQTEMSDTTFLGVDTLSSTFSIPEGSTFNYTDNYSINTDNVTDPFGDGSTVIPGGIADGTLFDPTDNSGLASEYPLFANRKVTLQGGNKVDFTYNQFNILYTKFQNVTANKYVGEQGQIMSLIGQEPNHPSIFALIPGGGRTLSRLYGGYTEPFVVSELGVTGYGDRVIPLKAATDDANRIRRFLETEAGGRFVEHMNIAASENPYAPLSYKPGSLLSGIPVLGINTRNRLDEGILGGALSSITNFITGGESIYPTYPKNYVDFDGELNIPFSSQDLSGESYGNIGQIRIDVDGTVLSPDEWLVGVTTTGKGKAPTFSTRTIYKPGPYGPKLGPKGPMYPLSATNGSFLYKLDTGDVGNDRVQIHGLSNLLGEDANYSGTSLYNRLNRLATDANGLLGHYQGMFILDNIEYSTSVGDDITIGENGFSNLEIGYHDTDGNNLSNRARNLGRVAQHTSFKSHLDNLGKGLIVGDDGITPDSKYLTGNASSINKDLTHSHISGRTVLPTLSTLVPAAVTDTNTVEIERDKKKLRAISTQFKNYSQLGFDAQSRISPFYPNSNYSQIINDGNFYVEDGNSGTAAADELPQQQKSMSPFERFGETMPVFSTPEGQDPKLGYPLGDPFTLFDTKPFVTPDKLEVDNALITAEIDREVHGMPLYFKDLRDNRILVFRAYISGLNESFSPNWESESYIGRSEPAYVYTGNEREVGFTLKLVSQTKDELTAIYEKLNRLTSMTYPEYKSASETTMMDADGEPVTLDIGAIGEKVRMKSPLLKFRLGELYGSAINKEVTCFIKTLSYTFPDESPWETAHGKRVPKFVDVDIAIQIIHDEVPSLAFSTVQTGTQNSFYGINLNGAPFGTST